MKQRLKQFLKSKIRTLIDYTDDGFETVAPELAVRFAGNARPHFSAGTGTHCVGLTLYCWDPTACIDIGKYCSIAAGVQFIAGGEHDLDWASSFPFIERWKITEAAHLLHKRYRGPIIIGNDVWLATNAIVLSGVTIGNGAVVGAGAVVTKDIPPYGIVAGNPAKLIRHRFDQDTIDKLQASKWWDLDEEKLRSIAPLLATPDEFATTALSLHSSGDGNA